MQSSTGNDYNDYDDYEIISSINNDGFNFFDTVHKSEKIVTYFLTYLDGDLFGDVTNNFIDYIYNNDTDIWNIYIELINKDKKHKIIEYINNFIKIITLYDTNKQLIIYDKLLKGKTILYINQIDLGNIFENLLNDHKLDVNKTTCFINRIIKNVRVKNKFIKYVANVYNKLIPEFMSDFYEVNIISINLFKILINIWKNEYTENKITTIQFQYIKSKKCPIKWYSKVNDTNKYTLYTVITFLIIAMIRVVLIPIYKKVKKLPTIIEETNNALDTQDIYILSLLGGLKETMTNKLIRYMTEYETYINFVESYEIKFTTKEFCNNFVQIINNTFNEDITLDDIVSVLYDYFLENITGLEKHIIEFAFKIINSKKYCKNIDVRFNYINLCKNTLHISQNSDFINALINIYNDFDTQGPHSKIYYNKKTQLYDTIISTSDKILDTLCITDYYKFHKFITYLIKDINDLNEIITELDSNITIFNMTNVKLVIDISSYIYNITQFILRLLKVENIRNIFLKEDIIIRLSFSINIYFGLIFKKIGFDQHIPNIIKKTTSNMLLICSIISDKTQKLINEIKSCDSYDLNNYILVSNYIKPTDIVLNFLNKLKYDIQYDEKEVLDIPDEFLDPITYKLIEEPILLPSMKTVSDDLFLDRVTINLQLTSKEENPFTREPLTIQQVDEYNNKPEILEKLNKFKYKLENWKKENIK